MSSKTTWTEMHRIATIYPTPRDEGTKTGRYGDICFSSSVYIANVRFAFANRLTMHTQHETHEDGESIF